jgi:hypothetical protein
VVLRDRDLAAWTAAASETLDERTRTTRAAAPCRLVTNRLLVMHCERCLVVRVSWLAHDAGTYYLHKEHAC